MTPPVYTLHIKTQITHEEAQLMLLCILGLTEDEMSKFLGLSKWEVKEMKEKIRNRLDIPKPGATTYILQKLGFSLDGCLNGTPILTRRELDRLQKIAPWVTDIRTLD